MSKPIRLNQDDVVSMEYEESPISATFKVSQLASHITGTLEYYDRNAKGKSNTYYSEWMEPGIGCEILRTDGGGWKSGKVRLTLEFIPDEPEPGETQEAELLPPSTEPSPLDDLRNELNIE